MSDVIKIVVEPTDPQDPAVPELVAGLRAIDPQAEVVRSGRVALSKSFNVHEIVRVLVEHGPEKLLDVIIGVVVAWAAKWFAGRPKASKVLIYGPTGKVIREVSREEPPGE